MKQSEILECLDHLKNLWSITEYAKLYISDIQDRINNEGIKKDYSKIHVLQKESQKWLILSYLQKHPNKIITGSDFMGIVRFWVPFIGYSASARLSELLWMWLIQKVGTRKSKIKFLFKAKDRNLYKITQKWLLFKLI